MKPTTAFLILCSLLAPSLSETQKKSKAVVLTRAVFEESFTGSQKDTLHMNPTLALLFAFVGVQSEEEGKFDKQLTPVCFVNLIKQGHGLINEECYKLINKLGSLEAKTKSLKLAYRCFKNTTILPNPGNYDLHTTKVDKVTDEGTAWLLYFTPKTSPTCAPKYLDNFALNTIVDTFARNQEDFLRGRVRINTVEPMTKEKYVASFKGLMEYFYRYQYTTFIFIRKIGTRELTRLNHCFVLMYENGKGVVHSKCTYMLDNLYRIDPTMHSLVLPYRCFLHESPGQYELHNTTINGFGLDKASPEGKYIIMFRLPYYDHCEPVLAEVSPDWPDLRVTGKDEL